MLRTILRNHSVLEKHKICPVLIPKFKGIKVYNQSLNNGPPYSPEEAINMGFALLSQSVWYNRFEAQDAFNEARYLIKENINLTQEKIQEYENTISYGEKKIDDVEISKSNNYDNNLFYYYDIDNSLKMFYGDKLGYDGENIVLLN